MGHLECIKYLIEVDLIRGILIFYIDKGKEVYCKVFYGLIHIN